MARAFITLGLPLQGPFRLWLADRVDVCAAIDPGTGEPIHPDEIADMAGELAGLLRSNGRQFPTDAEELLILADYLKTIGAHYQQTNDGAYAETAVYMGLWLEELAKDDDD